MKTRIAQMMVIWLVIICSAQLWYLAAATAENVAAKAEVIQAEVNTDSAAKISTSMAKKAGKQSGLGYLFETGMQKAGAAARRIGTIAYALSGPEVNWSETLTLLCGGQRGLARLGLFFKLALIIVLGLGAEWLLKRLTIDVRRQLIDAVSLEGAKRLWRILTRFLLDVLGVGAYMATTFVLLFFIFSRQLDSYYIVTAVVVSSYYLRLMILVAGAMLSPDSPGLRILPLKDRDATFFYRWIVLICFSATSFAAISSAFHLTGQAPEAALFAYAMAGFSVTILIVGMIWQSRQRVADAICPDALNMGEILSLRDRLAKRWHFFAIIYVLVTGLYWIGGLLVEGQGGLLNMMIGLFLIPTFIGIDQWGQRLIDILKKNEAEKSHAQDTMALPGTDGPAMTDSDTNQKKNGIDIADYVPRLKKALRILLIAFLFFVVLRLWGIDLPIGRFFTTTALSILIALILGFLVWEYSKTLIDRKLAKEMPEDDEEMEEGGRGGSRKGTLLVLLRKFILSVLFVIVSLIILSSIGVQIGPLIAGAGVIGLAIGFGAQTLVKDIISGVFFLIDDAFRVGDYVQTAGLKGMVEQISLRSMRLRHPRGMVHTIPFGDMGSVTNFSRDYIITKLDFRVRYDADVEKIRKIIKKKVFKEILKDKKLGSKLMGKIKSQGVREMDDSAMVMRVKYKTPPGEQFVIRREVFRLMQEAFQAEGIEFAHRNVTVYQARENPRSSDEAPAEQVAKEAAAAAAILADEANKKKSG